MTPSQNEMILHRLSEFCNHISSSLFVSRFSPETMWGCPCNLAYLWSCSDRQLPLNQFLRYLAKCVYFIQNPQVLNLYTLEKVRMFKFSRPQHLRKPARNNMKGKKERGCYLLSYLSCGEGSGKNSNCLLTDFRFCCCPEYKYC